MTEPREVEMNNDCDCVPGHRCDCTEMRRLLTAILTSAEYDKMAAEGQAADALGMVWDEHLDRYVAPRPDGTVGFCVDHFARLTGARP